jgi:hypothetical protein
MHKPGRLDLVWFVFPRLRKYLVYFRTPSSEFLLKRIDQADVAGKHCGVVRKTLLWIGLIWLGFFNQTKKIAKNHIGTRKLTK